MKKTFFAKKKVRIHSYETPASYLPRFIISQELAPCHLS